MMGAALGGQKLSARLPATGKNDDLDARTTCCFNIFLTLLTKLRRKIVLGSVVLAELIKQRGKNYV